MKHFIHLDVNVTTACNKFCTGCSHLAPHFEKEWMTAEELHSDLRALGKFIHFDRIQAVGGEPTIHPKLCDMLAVMRVSGIADQVVVITNGTRLTELMHPFWRCLDVLKLSVYPGLEHVAEIAEAKCRQHDVIFERQDYPEFYRQFKPVPDDGVESWRNCKWRNDCWTVHHGRLFWCPQSTFFHKAFPDLKPGEDGLELAGLTEEKLTAFLNRTEPLTACRHCTGGSSHAFPWKEERNKDKWMEGGTI